MLLREGEENDAGDIVIRAAERGQLGYVSKPRASSLRERDLWTTRLQDSEEAREEGYGHRWRPVEEVIVNGRFEGEALSWKGHDYALVRLGPASQFTDRLPPGTVAPACLARRGYGSGRRQRSNTAFFSGYGRRLIPHCLTDDRGPEAFETCGRPRRCTHDHRATGCGLRFLYDGQYYNECIQNLDTPSAADPNCKGLPPLRRRAHVFSSALRYLTTCYPARDAKGRGWCTTRPPGVDENAEPRYASGWGFCSGDERQKYCSSEVVPRMTDTRAKKMEFLTEDFCVEKLADNLKVEQPEVRKSEFASLSRGAGIECVGQNHTHNFDQDGFFMRSKNGSVEELSSLSKWELAQHVLASNGSTSLHNVDGGPVCFGDSGGPLFRLAPTRDGKLAPVITGVFSFILWGTCQGRAEPGYFGSVGFAEEWLKRYLPDDGSICWWLSQL